MNSSLSLSFELIYLMGWLLKNDQAKLKKLVAEAVEQGFIEEVDAMSDADYLLLSDQMQSTVEQFMDYLEDAITESVQGADAHNGVCKDLAPLLKKFDTDAVDQKTVSLAMQQTKKKLSYKKKQGDKINAIAVTEAEANDILFERLLKNWNPSKKDLMH